MHTPENAYHARHVHSIAFDLCETDPYRLDRSHRITSLCTGVWLLKGKCLKTPNVIQLRFLPRSYPVV